MLEKDQIIEIEITDMSEDGKGIGKVDGLAVFVECQNGSRVDAAGEKSPEYKSVVPGDIVRARVTKQKKHYAFAEAEGIVRLSPDRRSGEGHGSAEALPAGLPVCKYFGQCGGCQLQELKYEAQLKLKTEQVRSKLERIAGLQDPKVYDMTGAKTLNYYRDKASFSVGPHGEVGFLKGKSHFVIDIDDCLLQSDAAMVCAEALRVFLRKHPGKTPVAQMTVKTAFATGEVMVILDSKARDIQGLDELIEMFDDAVYSLNLDEDGTLASGEEFWSLESVAVIYNEKCRIAAGKPTITDEVICGSGTVKYEISPQSFYQVNPEQMVKLYEKAAEYAGIGNIHGNEGSYSISAAEVRPVVLDLYCGIGTIGIYLAEKARQNSSDGSELLNVIGIESVKPAVIDANRNSVINGLTGTRYKCGKAEEVLPEIAVDKADVVILDPPRAGCDEKLLDAVAGANPERIVYVSCDPATLSRDIKYLSEKGYGFVEATPVDMFPCTMHVETCVLLVRESVCDDELVSIKVDLDGINLDQGRYVPPEKPTYKNIKQWILDKYGFKVSTLYIAQIKDKVGLEKRKNYNPGSGEGKVPICPPEKEEAIMDAFRHYNLI